MKKTQTPRKKKMQASCTIDLTTKDWRIHLDDDEQKGVMEILEHERWKLKRKIKTEESHLLSIDAYLKAPSPFSGGKDEMDQFKENVNRNLKEHKEDLTRVENLIKLFMGLPK